MQIKLSKLAMSYLNFVDRLGIFFKKKTNVGIFLLFAFKKNILPTSKSLLF